VGAPSRPLEGGARSAPPIQSDRTPGRSALPAHDAASDLPLVQEDSSCGYRTGRHLGLRDSQPCHSRIDRVQVGFVSCSFHSLPPIACDRRCLDSTWTVSVTAGGPPCGREGHHASEDRTCPPVFTHGGGTGARCSVVRQPVRATQSWSRARVLARTWCHSAGPEAGPVGS